MSGNQSLKDRRLYRVLIQHDYAPGDRLVIDIEHVATFSNLNWAIKYASELLIFFTRQDVTINYNTVKKRLDEREVFSKTIRDDNSLLRSSYTLKISYSTLNPSINWESIKKLRDFRDKTLKEEEEKVKERTKKIARLMKNWRDNRE